MQELEDNLLYKLTSTKVLVISIFLIRDFEKYVLILEYLMNSFIYYYFFKRLVFIRPSLRRDVLWYTTVRPSVSHVTL